MFDPFTLSLGMGALSAVTSFFGSQKQSALQLQQANLMRDQVMEQDRRTRAEQAQTVGLATARAAASGASIQGSSSQQYLATMAEEYRRQADWQKNVGMTEASSVAAGAKSMQTAGGFQFGTDIAKTLYSFGKNNNWWMG